MYFHSYFVQKNTPSPSLSLCQVCVVLLLFLCFLGVRRDGICCSAQQPLQSQYDNKLGSSSSPLLKTSSAQPQYVMKSIDTRYFLDDGCSIRVQQLVSFTNFAPDSDMAHIPIHPQVFEEHEEGLKLEVAHLYGSSPQVQISNLKFISDSPLFANITSIQSFIQIQFTKSQSTAIGFDDVVSFSLNYVIPNGAIFFRVSTSENGVGWGIVWPTNIEHVLWKVEMPPFWDLQTSDIKILPPQNVKTISKTEIEIEILNLNAGEEFVRHIFFQMRIRSCLEPLKQIIFRIALLTGLVVVLAPFMVGISVGILAICCKKKSGLNQKSEPSEQKVKPPKSEKTSV